MREERPRVARRLSVVVASGLVVGALVAGAVAVGVGTGAQRPAAAPAGPTSAPGDAAARPGAEGRRPVLAFATKRGVVVVDGNGERLSTTRRKIGGFSVDGNVLTVVRRVGNSLQTVAVDARTGRELFRIKNTLLTPTVLRNGKAVAFSGQGKRDPYATSLWLRERRGRERQLVGFSFGGTPGVATGMTEGGVLEYSFSRKGDMAAVVAGDDYADFSYDIWTVDVASRKPVRITRGRSSRYPAVSPRGDRVAYFREERMCGGPMPGFRGGDLVVVKPDGTGRRRIHDGTCQQYLTRPRWLSAGLLVAVRYTRRPGANPDPLYDTDVVIVDVDRRQISAPISETARVGDITVSPSARQIAYNDWTRPEGFWVFNWTPGSSTTPGQPSWAQGSSTYQPQGWAPHLRGDHTVSHAY